VRAVFLDNLGFERILQGRFAGARGIGSGATPVKRRAEVDE
jgi:phosphonate transport system permease protein